MLEVLYQVVKARLEYFFDFLSELRVLVLIPKVTPLEVGEGVDKFALHDVLAEEGVADSRHDTVDLALDAHVLLLFFVFVQLDNVIF